MRKALLFALMMTLCLSLTGCGGETAEKQETEELQMKFQNLSAATVEAELTCHYGDEVRTYTLRCSYTPEESTVEVLAPEDLAGISATLTGEALTLQYDGILETGREALGETECLRVTFEMTSSDGGKQYTAVWFDENGIPLQGEITLEETVVYTAVLTQFTAEETDHGTITEEDLGGD